MLRTLLLQREQHLTQLAEGSLYVSRHDGGRAAARNGYSQAHGGKGGGGIARLCPLQAELWGSPGAFHLQLTQMTAQISLKGRKHHSGAAQTRYHRRPGGMPRYLPQVPTPWH